MSPDTRINLRLPKTHHDYLSEVSWKARTNMTQYMRELIEKDMRVNNYKTAQSEASAGLDNPYDGF